MTLYCRFAHNNAVRYGIMDGDRIQAIEGDIFGERTPAGEAIGLADCRLLAPLVPGTILAAAVNYQSHVPSGSAVLKEDGAPQVPQLFLKPASSVIGPGDTIVLLAEARRVDAEGELVAVIGRECRKVAEADAQGYIFGYTCGNDVSARHWQRDDIQWWRAKGSDTFSPLGPVIATDLDPAKLRLRTLVNGEVRQDSDTGQLIHSIAKMIAFASQVMTLRPGDLLFTGTPGEPPKLEDGDVVDIEIEGIGTLTNPVRREA
ncbi:MAG TPA: fumarylacetoacetate hydrolase family protein [Dehalococcoidia bacterium]|nr:fumarylacetoacetate hydrolase family protein [Dehalococcoidia bacterium]